MQMDVLEAVAMIAGSYNVVFHQYEFSEKGVSAADRVSFDGGIREWCLPDYNEGDYLRQLFAKIQPGQLIRFVDIFQCRYLLLRGIMEGQPRTLAIGPYLSESNTQDSTRKIQDRFGWDTKMGESLLEYRSCVPVIVDEAPFVLMIRRIAAPLFGDEKVLPFSEWIEQADSGFSFQIDRDEQYEQAMAAYMIEQRYKKENEWLDAMLTGNMDKMSAAMRELARFQLPGRFQSLRGAQNIAIILNTLCRKNIERAGVHPAFIDQIARQFTGRIDSCITERELRVLQKDILREYCMAVNRYAAQGVSPLIRKVMSDVLLQLDSAVSLKQLAEQAGVGESYLSSRFKEETGQTFGCWLREKRMERARQLLLRENLSVAQVAEQVGILDVSYFIRIFRKQTGMTPGEYRKQELGKRIT